MAESGRQEVPISPSVQALRNLGGVSPSIAETKKLEFKSELPDIRLQLTKKGSGVGGGGTEADLAALQQEIMTREELMGELTKTPTKILMLDVLRGLHDQELNPGDPVVHEYKVGYSFTLRVQEIWARAGRFEEPVESFTWAGAKEIEILTPDGKTGTGFYSGLTPDYGLESRYFLIGNEDDKDHPPKLIRGVRLGTEDERKTESETDNRFIEQVIARIKFSTFFGMFKANSESLANLTSFYLATSHVNPENMEAEFCLDALPQDQAKRLISKGGVEFPKKTGLGRMMSVAQQIFEATGLCEKPEAYKNFIKPPGFGRVVSPDLVEKQKVMKDWFGDPEVEGQGWKNPPNPDTWKPGEYNVRDEDTWKEEDGTRGILTKRNVFAGDLESDEVREYKDNVAEFLGGSATAKLAVDLAFKNYRLFASADMVGYEWYLVKGEGVDETGKPVPDGLIVKIPLGGDQTGDFGKIVRPREYLTFYAETQRGGIPRGAYGKEGYGKKLTPLAVDVLRGISITKKGETSKGSMYKLMFEDGLWPDELDYNKLPDRALISPYLRMFMAVCGPEYGEGSFDILTDKIDPGPEKYLNPAFWQTLQKKLYVGIKKETVGWYNYVKNNGTVPYTQCLPPEGKEGDKVIEKYRLDVMRLVLDAIFAEEGSRKWDKEPDKGRGATQALRLGKKSKDVLGVAIVPEKDVIYLSHEIIDVANNTISGLNYSPDRLEEVRRNFKLVY